jgi:hypothetical protein
MKGQYHLIRRFNLLKDFRKYLLSNKTMRNDFINYGVNWMDYLENQNTFPKRLTRDGQVIKTLVDNAERIVLERDIEKHNQNGYDNFMFEKAQLNRLAELKNNAIPVFDQKRINQILDRRERKAKRHGISIEK